MNVNEKEKETDREKKYRILYERQLLLKRLSVMIPNRNKRSKYEFSTGIDFTNQDDSTFSKNCVSKIFENDFLEDEEFYCLRIIDIPTNILLNYTIKDSKYTKNDMYECFYATDKNSLKEIIRVVINWYGESILNCIRITYHSLSISPDLGIGFDVTDVLLPKVIGN